MILTSKTRVVKNPAQAGSMQVNRTRPNLDYLKIGTDHHGGYERLTVPSTPAYTESGNSRPSEDGMITTIGALSGKIRNDRAYDGAMALFNKAAAMQNSDPRQLDVDGKKLTLKSYAAFLNVRDAERKMIEMAERLTDNFFDDSHFNSFIRMMDRICTGRDKFASDRCFNAFYDVAMHPRLDPRTNMSLIIQHIENPKNGIEDAAELTRFFKNCRNYLYKKTGI